MQISYSGSASKCCEIKMLGHLMSLLVISLCCTVCKANDSCNVKIALQHFDEAIDFIKKGKSFVLKQPNFENNITRKAMDCSELLKSGYRKSGVYTIWPESRISDNKPLQVYCDMETDGGGWTLIQRRGPFGRPVDYFFKDWKSYKEGFGDVEKDFWLGNDNIFALTNQKIYTARFDLKDFENDTRYAQYDTFWIDDESSKYTLHVSDYTGDAGDSLVVYHNSLKFSTKDEDNDNRKDQSCSEVVKGAWWYDNCHFSNLNGLYHQGKHESDADGVNWKTWKGYKESMKSTEIKIRPKKFKPPHVSLNTTPM